MTTKSEEWRPHVRRPTSEELDQSAALCWEESCGVRAPDKTCPDWQVFDAERNLVCRTDSREKALIIARAVDGWIHICLQADLPPGRCAGGSMTPLEERILALALEAMSDPAACPSCGRGEEARFERCSAKQTNHQVHDVFEPSPPTEKQEAARAVMVDLILESGWAEGPEVSRFVVHAADLLRGHQCSNRRWRKSFRYQVKVEPDAPRAIVAAMLFGQWPTTWELGMRCVSNPIALVYGANMSRNFERWSDMMTTLLLAPPGPRRHSTSFAHLIPRTLTAAEEIDRDFGAGSWAASNVRTLLRSNAASRPFIIQHSSTEKK